MDTLKKVFGLKTILFICHLTIFYNYKLFILFYFSIATYIVYSEINLDKFSLFLIKFIPLNFYLINLSKLFFNDSKSIIFWDMQNFLHYINCNQKEILYTYKFNNFIEKCPETIGYGPLTEFLYFGNDHIWFLTIFFGILFIVINAIFLIKSKKNLIIISAILLSPSFQFLFYSLNSDIFVLLYLIWLIGSKNYKKTNLNIFIISFLALIKTYPLFLLLGYLLLSISKKERFNILKSLLAFLLNLFILINHYFLNTSFLPDPISFTRSFGILHDFKLMSDFIGFDEGAVLLTILVFFSLIFRKLIVNYFLNNTFLLPDDIIDKVIILLPTLYLINFYQNWGYKFVLNSLLIFLIFNFVKKNTQIFLIGVNLLCITYFFIGWGYENSFLNLLFFSLSKTLYYLFLLFIFYLTYNLFKNHNYFNH